MVGRPGNTLYLVKDSCEVDWMHEVFPRCSMCKVVGKLVKESAILLWKRCYEREGCRKTAEGKRLGLISRRQTMHMISPDL